MERDSGPVEMRPVGETEFVNGVAAMCASGYCGKTRVAAGIVGQADLRLGRRAEAVLTALMRAGGDRFRGIRHITAWDADTSLNNPAYPAGPGLLGDKTFREGFALLGKYGLSFDAWLYHPQIGELVDLAGDFPGTKIVLNHCGGPIGSGAYQGKRDEVLTKWQASIKALAAHPNVFVKVGGLGQAINGIGLNELPQPPSSEVLAKHFPALCRNLYRSVRRFALHVRKQFPGGQGVLQLPGVLERVQTAGEERKPIGKDGPFLRNSRAVLPADGGRHLIAAGR